MISACYALIRMHTCRVHYNVHIYYMYMAWCFIVLYWAQIVKNLFSDYYNHYIDDNLSFLMHKILPSHITNRSLVACWLGIVASNQSLSPLCGLPSCWTEFKTIILKFGITRLTVAGRVRKSVKQWRHFSIKQKEMQILESRTHITE